MSDESTPNWKLRQVGRGNAEHLQWAEGQIMKGFTMAADAIADVKKRESWKGEYSSLYDWAKHAMSLSAPRVCQLLESREVRLSLLESNDDDVRAAADEMAETALRVVSPLPKKARERVVRKAMKDGDVTARHLKEIISPDAIIPPQSTECCPHCGQPMKKSSSRKINHKKAAKSASIPDWLGRA